MGGGRGGEKEKEEEKKRGKYWIFWVLSVFRSGTHLSPFESEQKVEGSRPTSGEGRDGPRVREGG